MKTNHAPQFTVTVSINTAAIQGSLNVTFVAKRISESKAIEKRVQEDGTGVAGFVKAVAVDVRDVKLSVELTGLNADGRFDSTADGLTELLDWPGVGGPIQNAYYRGLWEEQEKNSEPPAHG